MCSDVHMGYTILSAIMLCVGCALGGSVSLERFYEVDLQCARLEREKEDLLAQIRQIKLGTELSMRILQTIHGSSEDTDSSGTDV